MFRLGSVPLAIGLYKKAGFRAESFTTAQEASLPIHIQHEDVDLGKDVHVKILELADLPNVVELDARFFGSRRTQLLTDIYKSSLKDGCLCLEKNGNLLGFIMVRRRQVSKKDGGFAEGPEYAYRLGPCSVLPEYGINGFKTLFQQAIQAVNNDIHDLNGDAKMYVVFPRNADKETIYIDTKELAKAMGINIDLDRVFDEHQDIFKADSSKKNDEQWRYMQSLDFHQEYFEQVMSCTPGEPIETKPTQRKAYKSRARPEGIFASATPGDKA